MSGAQPSQRSAGPLVSVCIPTYNRPAALATVIRSILAQTYPHIEIIVTDDGDAAKTRPHLAAFGDKVQYHANASRLGLYANWNHAIRLATGSLVAVYHDHDDYAPTMVERSVRLFQENPRVGIVHVAARLQQLEGGVVDAVHHDLPVVADGRWFAEQQAWRWGSYVAHGAMMVRKDLYERLGTFDESIGIAADMDMLNRFCLETDIGYVHEPLYGYSGRRPEDPLFEFKWAHVVEYANVRRRNFERLYHDRPALRALALAALRMQLDERLLRQLLVASVHRKSDAVAEGVEIVRRHGSAGAYRLARTLAHDGAAARRLRDDSYRAYKWVQRRLAPTASAAQREAR